MSPHPNFLSCLLHQNQPFLQPCLFWLSSAIRLLSSFCHVIPIRLRASIHQLRHGMGIPWLHLIPLSHQLHLGPLTNWLCPGSSTPPGTVIPLASLGSTLVIATDFWTVCCAPFLHSYGSIGLLHPPGSTAVFTHTGVASGPLAPLLQLVAGTPPWSPGPLMLLGVSVHRTSPGPHHVTASL